MAALYGPDRARSHRLQYPYHDGLLEQVRLDVAARSVELRFFLYAVFDRPQARVAIRLERIVNFPAVCLSLIHI